MKLLVMLIAVSLLLQTAYSQENYRKPFQLSQMQFELVNGELVEAQGGYILVPENRLVSDSRLIPINFIRFISTSDSPAAPIVYLAGGPGSSGLQAASRRYLFFEKLRETSDVIVFDQRGTGENDLTCPEKIYLPIDLSLSYEAVIDLFIRESLPCKEYFEGLGFDLAGYTTVQSAEDVNDLRKALKIDKISLIGSSYGSHYALAILKYFDEFIDRVVISGVEGPNHTLSLPSDFDSHLDDIDLLWREQTSSYSNLSKLRDMLWDVIERLGLSPITVAMINADTGRDYRVQIGKFEVRLLMYSLLGRDRSIGRVPKLIYAMSQGEFEEVAQLVLQLKSNGQLISAMLIMMDGSSGASRERLAYLEAQENTTVLGPVVHFLFPEIAQAWDAPDLGDYYRMPVYSDRPVLIISGSMDARTPVSNGDEIARGLVNSQHVIIENSGHPPSLSATGDLINNFLLGKTINSVDIDGLELKFLPIE